MVKKDLDNLRRVEDEERESMKGQIEEKLKGMMDKILADMNNGVEGSNVFLDLGVGKDKSIRELSDKVK